MDVDTIQPQAISRHARTVQQLAERHPFDPVEWKKGREAWEGWPERTADELVLQDRVLVHDEETERAMREGGYTD